MNFIGTYLALDGALKQNGTWSLLHQQNAPLIIAFITSAFEKERDIRYDEAKALLDAYLQELRERDYIENVRLSSDYLREWIKKGWLRENSNQLTRTDACQRAIDFCKTLEQDNVTTTASRLRLVQDMLRDFTITHSEDREEALSLLELQREELDRRINELRSGKQLTHDPAHTKEQVQQIHQLTSELTSDFRRLEDDLRLLEREMRTDMIQNENARGDVLLEQLEKEEGLFKTSAGVAFRGFNALLSDAERSVEFAAHLKSLLAGQHAKVLTQKQQKELRYLNRNLTDETQRILNVKRQIEKGFRYFIESGALSEGRLVEKQILECERVLLKLNHNELNYRESTSLLIDVGPSDISFATNITPRDIDAFEGVSNIVEHKSSNVMSDELVAGIKGINTLRLAQELRDIAHEHGPLRLATLLKEHRPSSTFGEVIYCIQIASFINAPGGDDAACVEIEQDGAQYRVNIPNYILTKGTFPHDLKTIEL